MYNSIERNTALIVSPFTGSHTRTLSIRYIHDNNNTIICVLYNVILQYNNNIQTPRKRMRQPRNLRKTIDTGSRCLLHCDNNKIIYAYPDRNDIRRWWQMRCDRNHGITVTIRLPCKRLVVFNEFSVVRMTRCIHTTPYIMQGWPHWFKGGPVM